MNKNIDNALCRPNRLFSCSVCCGCFNLSDISRGSLTAFLESGLERVRRFEGGNKQNFHQQVRDETTHICPFQGFDASTLPGCLLHEEIRGEDGRDASLYGGAICGDYFCPAHHLLDEGAKRLLLGMELDWYLYSVAILDPLGFVWMLDRAFLSNGQSYGPDRPQEKVNAAVALALDAHADFLNGLEGPIFHYSTSEYLLEYHHFSPASGSPATEGHRNSLSRLISGHSV